MMRFSNTSEVISDKTLIAHAKRDNDKFDLTETDICATLRSINIYDVPKSAELLKIDNICISGLYCDHDGTNYLKMRCDYAIVDCLNKRVVFLELKSSKTPSVEI